MAANSAPREPAPAQETTTRTAARLAARPRPVDDDDMTAIVDGERLDNPVDGLFRFARSLANRSSRPSASAQWLRHRAPNRVAVGNIDGLVFAELYHLAPEVLDAVKMEIKAARRSTQDI
jgi:hypothetical protein